MAGWGHEREREEESGGVGAVQNSRAEPAQLVIRSFNIIWKLLHMKPKKEVKKLYILQPHHSTNHVLSSDTLTVNIFNKFVHSIPYILVIIRN